MPGDSLCSQSDFAYTRSQSVTKHNTPQQQLPSAAGMLTMIWLAEAVAYLSHWHPMQAQRQPPHRNGSTPPSQENSTQTNTNELSQLRNEVSKLSELVTNQARMLQGQMKDLEDARSLIDMHAMTNTLSMAAPTQTIRAGWNKDVQPFEVQRNAIGDRRYLGGYDARYHSTNM